MVGWSDELEKRWMELGEEAFTGIAEWRLAHPKATLSEIEAAIDERLSRVRARMLQDAALASAARDVRTASPEERPRCPDCGELLEAHGREERKLTTTYDRTISLNRSYAVCPKCRAGFFPPR